MAEYNRYGRAANQRRRSGTRAAKRRKQLAATVVAFLLCAGIGLLTYRFSDKPSEGDAKQVDTPTPTPTPTPEVGDATVNWSEQVGPWGLYMDGYLANADAESTWMEDFEDTRERVNVKAAYCPADRLNDRLPELLHLLDTTEVNAIIFDVKNDDGFITVKTDSELIASMENTYVCVNDFENVMATLKEHGAYLIARVVCFRDVRSVRAREDFGIRKTDGTLLRDSSNYTWMNPFNEDTWEYLTEVGKQCAALGFDEVNFDYVRFSTDSQMANADFGFELTAEKKKEAITGFVRYACERLKPLGVFVSADVYGVVMSSRIDASIVGQDYAAMSRYLDYICPMVYPSHYSNGYYNLDYPDTHPYELVYNAMLDSKEELEENVRNGRCAESRPWIQAFTASWISHHLEYGGAEIRAQLNATYDAGYSGWLLWNAAGYYSGDGLEAEDTR